MSLPAVSLVMLYKDREAQVVKTLESIVDQRYEPLVRNVAARIPEFRLWAMGWLAGKPDLHGDDAREISEKMMQLKDGEAISVAEAAYALRCWENAMQAGATDSAEHLMAWARTAATCATRGEGAK